jgi:hypothetical protein
MWGCICYGIKKGKIIMELNYKYQTVKQLARSTGWTEASIRYWIFHAKKNGLEKAIIRIGRRVLIDIEAFTEWLESHRYKCS